ncbi:TonB-dependent receptor [Peristeroidobacter soli]|uniref:TonB-dependent receptor n=1 Tax=Peristeroidobacter soli TaxID=2497877 RepID=UPI00158D5A00|nr:TonB-dependent receptor [Peristeroidobacter soli]
MKSASVGVLLLSVVGFSFAADSWAEIKRSTHVEAQGLGPALEMLAKEHGFQVLYRTEIVGTLRSRPLQGEFSTDEALRALLDGTGLTYRVLGDQAITIVPVGGGSSSSEGSSDKETSSQTNPSGVGRGEEVVVTGSHIRGAPTASTVISLDQKQMLDAGQNSLADVVRAIPQNFGGGQNPGVGFNVPSGSGVNLGGASSINLRGLGSDATLTLLNGHRLSYSSSRQSVDISSIPVIAVDRIEIVADGASALYGSDAVAGVANIVLKRDYDGLGASARYGFATDGGDRQQQYSAIGGKTWDGGGFMAAYEFEHDTAITADQRSYAATRSPGLTLFPELKHHNLIVAGHQEIAPDLVAEFDAMYNKRWTNNTYALNSAGNYMLSGARYYYEVESYAVAPALKYTFGNAWRASMSGMYGVDRTHFGSDQYAAASLAQSIYACYCNNARSLELTADGPLFSLPAGDAKVALGAGYRSNQFRLVPIRSTAAPIDATTNAYFGVAELSLPLISASQNVPFIREMNFSAAIRYEDYADVDQVATPKLGLIYAPSRDFEFKASWGKSFRTPTLFQLYNVRGVTLYSAASRGGVGYPSTATALMITGGNPDLESERATTWSATISVQPRVLDGAKFELSYYDVRYKDRIVAPITFTAQALRNPIYGDQVNFAPTDADKAAAIAGGTFSNTLTVPYNPANVIAIINNGNLNAANLTVHGFDLSTSYPWDLRGAGTLNLVANASFIRSKQQLSSRQPVVQLAGRLFNPPHYRGRAGFAWENGETTVSSFVTYIGGVTDARTTTVTKVSGMTTWDMTLRHQLGAGTGLLSDMDFTLSVQNLLNARPDVISTSVGFDMPYDSTNYSPVGRFIDLSIAKRW